ncbi:hypothetical protein CEXT_129411 [Caerostris extrusa]|uniref:Peptidase S1 domain-containing protein n=1 Tax=Caerostris extrusa TaxID=172846 RepID=A0AAV4Q367_CAEEX|nr:hypothetical protein CEXT_129411 [Caerostris extrusa]
MPKKVWHHVHGIYDQMHGKYDIKCTEGFSERPRRAARHPSAPQMRSCSAQREVVAHGCSLRLRPVSGEYDVATNSNSRQDIGIETLITHPQYQEPYRQSNDIALLRLNRDAIFTESVWPVCLPFRSTEVTGMNATVAGWGQTSFTGIPARSLSWMVNALNAYLDLYWERECQPGQINRRIQN